MVLIVQKVLLVKVVVVENIRVCLILVGHGMIRASTNQDPIVVVNKINF
jgi:hypothetical protein